MVKFGSAWPSLSATTAGSLGALQRLRAGEAGLSSDCEDSAVGTPHRGVLHGGAVTGQRWSTGEVDVVAGGNGGFAGGEVHEVLEGRRLDRSGRSAEDRGWEHVAHRDEPGGVDRLAGERS